jgi:hypothetical protein
LRASIRPGNHRTAATRQSHPDRRCSLIQIVALQKREFIQVLRLMEAAPQDVVAYAVTEAIRLGAIGFDAVKQITLARIERRPIRLDLAAYPHLPQLAVKTTTAADYAVLVPEMAA